MRLFVQTLCLLTSLLLAQNLWAERKITANALFADRAVLLIDGEPVFFAVGDSRKGIVLLAANETHAIIKIDGKERTLYLDKGIAEEYAKAKDLQSGLAARSHIISAVVIHQTANLATFQVEYFYNKELGDRASLSAKTLWQNDVTNYWAHTHTALAPGRNTVSITVSMNEKAPASYNSDAVRFDMNWVKGKEAGVTGTLVLPFLKTWKQ